MQLRIAKQEIEKILKDLIGFDDAIWDFDSQNLYVEIDYLPYTSPNKSIFARKGNTIVSTKK
jgi:hypothetical protein